ncbi:MAG: serine/threonine-protein kinase [Caldimonas sp.]
MIQDSVIDWQELSALYEQAEGLDESGREALLVQLRSQKHRLLGQLERMLRARDRIATSSFLESLPRLQTALSPSASPSDLGEGSRVGAYRLIRPIGSGGMAEVWLAERADGAFDRQVAIKLLFNHPTRSERSSFVARFERERDILASLHHPHIAGLHDAGVTTRGELWLALEYVRGDQITAWCDKKQLALKERVLIFRQVLAAVEHAHANLIIHRDLKPSNILVADEGEVKLLDFGIAKLMEPDGRSTDASELTREAGRPLTLQYASPEQLGGRPLTTASDVYSLGVVLYELLYGARPYDAARSQSAAQLESAILVGDVAPPSRRVTEAAAAARSAGRRALARALAGDLDAVTMKALHGDAAKRYPSVEALRLDLERWCEGRPVGAQPASIGYRAGKFYLRHRLGVWSGSIALSSILALSAAAVYAGLKAQSESSRAIASRDFVVDLFRLAEPETSRGRSMTPRELLQAGRRRAVEALATQPALQADVFSQIGAMQLNVADYKGADESLGLAASLFARYGPARDWVLTQIQLAENATYMGDARRARRELAAVQPRIDAFGDDVALLARYWQVTGFLSRSQDDHEAALGQLTKAVALTTRAHGPDHVNTIDAMRDLAATYSEAGRLDEAASIWKDASHRASANPAIARRVVLGIDADLAITAIKSGRYAATLEPLRSLIARCDVEFGVYEDNCVILVEALAWLSLRLEDSATGRSVIARLLSMAANDSSPLRQAANANLGAELMSSERRLQEHPDLTARLRRIVGTEELPIRVRTQALLALALDALRSDNLAGASEEIDRAKLLQASTPRPDRDLVARARLLRGLVHHRRGDLERALAETEGAASDLATALGAAHPLAALYRCNAAVVLARMGRRTKAVQVIESALPVVSKGFGTAPVVRRLETLLAELRVEPHNLSPRSTNPDAFL